MVSWESQGISRRPGAPVIGPSYKERKQHSSGEISEARCAQSFKDINPVSAQKRSILADIWVAITLNNGLYPNIRHSPHHHVVSLQS